MVVAANIRVSHGRTELRRAEPWGCLGDGVSQHGVTRKKVWDAGTKSFGGKNHFEWQI